MPAALPWRRQSSVPPLGVLLAAGTVNTAHGKPCSNLLMRNDTPLTHALNCKAADTLQTESHTARWAVCTQPFVKKDTPCC